MANFAEIVSLVNGNLDATNLTPGIFTADLFLNNSIQPSKLAGGIPATKISGGGVSNTEFDRLAGVSSGIQNQFNAHVGVGGVAQHPAATPSVAGFMSAADKTALDAHIGAGGAAHALATESVAGFMSAADKAALNGALPTLSGGTADPTPNSLARRDSLGSLRVGNGSGVDAGTSLATTANNFQTRALNTELLKDYLSSANPNPNRLVRWNPDNRLFVNNPQGGITGADHPTGVVNVDWVRGRSTISANPETLVLRDGAGRSTINPPVKNGPALTVATKSYVDLLAHIGLRVKDFNIGTNLGPNSMGAREQGILALAYVSPTTVLALQWSAEATNVGVSSSLDHTWPVPFSISPFIVDYSVINNMPIADILDITGLTTSLRASTASTVSLLLQRGPEVCNVVINFWAIGIMSITNFNNYNPAGLNVYRNSFQVDPGDGIVI
jgi:hypothetical protein